MPLLVTVLLVAVAVAVLPGQATGAAAAAAATADLPVIVQGRTWTLRNGTRFSYGRPGDIHVMGDWDRDGVATPGVFRSGTWYLRNQLAGGNADIVFGFGRAGDVPVVGDWNGDGRTTIGVVRGTTWLLRNSNAAGNPHVRFTFGERGGAPVTGDWNGDGRTGVGMVRDSAWRLRNTLSAGPAEIAFTYGRAGDRPVTGDWNGNGCAAPGVVRGCSWYLRHHLAGGNADVVFTFGACGDAALSTSSAQTARGVPTSLRGTEWTRLPTSEKVVALTFDAGANADGLPKILQTLEETGTPATFFLTGAWTEAEPELAQQVAARYPVGNHTMTHPDLTKLSDAAVRQEIMGADTVIRDAIGRELRPWFRFPYGARDTRTISAANCLNYGSVRWSVDTLGWKGTSGGQSTTTVRTRVLNDLGPGSIVLMHVGSHPTDHSTLDADALRDLITRIEARGYRFVDLDAYL